MELKSMEVIMKLNPIAGQNAKNEICIKADKVSELIRCGECKHWVEGVVYDFCNRYSVRIPRGADEYCSDAERSEEL